MSKTNLSFQDGDHGLKAILFSDIVGYTRTMQRDETEALTQVEKHKSSLDQLANKMGGQILNFYGDGCLVIFESALDAVEFGNRLVDTLKVKGVPVRIGIHLGEISFFNGEYFGDGINLASRVQGKAEPNEVWVSESIRDVLKNKSSLKFSCQGEFELKNVENPQKLFTAHISEYKFPVSGGRQTPVNRPLKKRYKLLSAIFLFSLLAAIISLFANKVFQSGSNHRAILVMPFQALSDEANLWAQGISDDIRMKLAGIDEFDVKSRSTSIHIKEQKWPAQKISSEMDVGYILEGTVNVINSELELNLSLINARADRLIAPVSYTIQLADEFMPIQAQIVKRIIELIDIKLVPSQSETIENMGTESFEAYKNYLMGQHFGLKSMTRPDLTKSAEFFKSAIREDENFAEAYAALAETIMLPVGWGYASLNSVMDEADFYLDKARQLESNSAEYFMALASVYNYRGNLPEAEDACKKAIELNPGMEGAYRLLGLIETIRGEKERAMFNVRKAIELNPYYGPLKSQEVRYLMRLGDYSTAVEVARRHLEVHPGDNVILFALAQTYVMMENYDQAVKTLLDRSVSSPDKNWLLGYAYGKMGFHEEALDILSYHLEKAEQVYVPPSMIAAIYLGLGKMEDAKSWYQQEDFWFMKTFPMLEELSRETM
jgi:tetratricopeptide (TPR) repeat protein